MTTARKHEDGELPAAKTRLNQAITKLFDPLGQNIAGQWREAPSYFDQLCDSIHGQTGERSGGNSGLPLWPDALDLRNTIDTQLAQWNNGRGYTSMDRVCLLDMRAWKPQETQLIDLIATTMESWRLTIIGLLYPPPRLEVLAACPSCGHRYVQRHSAGEQIRQPALQVTANGCQCQNHHCKAHWGPEQFPFLLNLLGFEKPEGIFE